MKHYINISFNDCSLVNLYSTVSCIALDRFLRYYSFLEHYKYKLIIESTECIIPRQTSNTQGCLQLARNSEPNI